MPRVEKNGLASWDFSGSGIRSNLVSSGFMGPVEGSPGLVQNLSAQNESTGCFMFCVFQNDASICEIPEFTRTILSWGRTQRPKRASLSVDLTRQKTSMYKRSVSAYMEERRGSFDSILGSQNPFLYDSLCTVTVFRTLGRSCGSLKTWYAESAAAGTAFATALLDPCCSVNEYINEQKMDLRPC